MNFHKLFTSVISRVQPHALPLVIATVGLIFLVYGLISSLASSQNEKDFVFTNENATSSATLENTQKMVVDVEGAVENPGVYKISSDARIQDALILAGGFSKDADRDFISKHLNLAAKLTDGAKVYIPKVGESNGSSSVSTSTNSTTSNAETVLSAQSGQININTASASELDTLSGVGVVTAQKIIDNRPYSDINELLNKKVVGNSVFQKIKDKITVY